MITLLSDFIFLLASSPFRIGFTYASPVQRWDANFASSFHFTILLAVPPPLHLTGVPRAISVVFSTFPHTHISIILSIRHAAQQHIHYTHTCRWPSSLPTTPPNYRLTPLPSLHLNLCCTFLFSSWFAFVSARPPASHLLFAFFNSDNSVRFLYCLYLPALHSRVFPFISLVRTRVHCSVLSLSLRKTI